MNTPDPFANIPAADPATVEVRQRAFARPEQACGLGSMERKKKRVDLNPHQRRWFEKHGYTFERTEHHNAWKGRTQDLFGCFDYVAARADQPGTLYVQVTDAVNLRARRRKVLAAPATAVLLASGNRVQIHSWSQPGGAGTRWEMSIEEVTGDDLGGGA